jgi:hypothetical protein
MVQPPTRLLGQPNVMRAVLKAVMKTRCSGQCSFPPATRNAYNVNCAFSFVDWKIAEKRTRLHPRHYHHCLFFCTLQPA